MSGLRIVVGLIVLVYALASGAIAGAIVAVKQGVWTAPNELAVLGRSIPTAEEVQLALSIPWAQLVLWATVVLLYLIVAIKLLRRVKSFLTWALAFVLSAGNWLWLRANPTYENLTPPDLVNADYVALGASLILGVLILWMGRTHLD